MHRAADVETHRDTAERPDDDPGSSGPFEDTLGFVDDIGAGGHDGKRYPT